MEKKLKILFCGNFNTNSVGEPEIAKCFEELGHEVDRLEERSTNPQKILEMVKNKDYDIFLFSKLRVGIWPEVNNLLKTLNEKKVRTICWLFDLYFGL